MSLSGTGSFPPDSSALPNNRRNILYYSLDDPSLSAFSDNVMKDVLDYFLENIAVEGKKYVFFDEIHLFIEWYKWMKSFYDRKENTKYVLTGSSSLTLQRDANAFLRGRLDTVEMFPLDFKEFARFCGINVPEISFEDMEKLDALEISKICHDLNQAFREYFVVGGFPEWFDVKKQREARLRWFSLLIHDIPKKAIFEDITRERRKAPCFSNGDIRRLTRSVSKRSCIM